MAGSMPLVVDVLARLSSNYQIATNRLNQARKAAGMSARALRREINRQQRRIASRPKNKRRPYWELCEKNAVTKLKTVAVDDQREDAVHLHPFPDVVERIARWTGCKTETIHKAAAKGFSGYPKVVAELRKLDGSPELLRLYRQLIEEHPALASRIGITLEQLSDQLTPAEQKVGISGKKGRPQATTKQRGRPIATDHAADRRLAEAWATGQYETYEQLAREKGIRERAVRLALDRHRKR